MPSTKSSIAQPLRVDLSNGQSVSALAQGPADAKGCLVLAHGAGAGMDHSFMRAVAAGLAERHIATFRFQFPFMEAGSKRPDRPLVAHATVRAAAAAAQQVFQGVPLFAGGKSFGGRMTSQAEALEPLAGVRGLVFFGFPLHPAGKPSSERAAHLNDVQVPMLFLQGTRDLLAELPLMQQLMKLLGSRASLEVIEHADHSFHVPSRSGRNDQEALTQALDAAAQFITHTKEKGFV
jgi:predicted alpha/beta-hydrolase family hydrolase